MWIRLRRERLNINVKLMKESMLQNAVADLGISCPGCVFHLHG